MIAEKSKLEIVDFSTYLSENKVAIRWSTENESSSKETFEVQRTVDGNNFQTIASVDGFCKGSNSYEVIDADFKGSPVFLAYRIRHIPPSGNPRVTPSVDFIETDYQFQNFKRLTPDPNNGLIRAKYAINYTSNISIRLVDYQNEVSAWSRTRRAQPT